MADLKMMSEAIKSCCSTNDNTMPTDPQMDMKMPSMLSAQGNGGKNG
jgi:hypothetical protein